MKANTGKILKWLGLLVLGLVAVYIVLLLLSGWRLARARAGLVAAGRPVDVGPLLPKPVAEIDNSALLYNAAVQVLKATSWQPDNAEPARSLAEALGDLQESWPSGEAKPEDWSKWEGLLRDPAAVEALSLIERGTSRPGCCFDVDWSKGPMTLLPHLAGLRTLSRLVAGHARLEARAGHAPGAWRNVGLGLKLARAAQAEPCLISQLVLIAQTNIALTAAVRIQEQVPLDPATLQMLDEALKPLDDPRLMYSAIEAERLLFGEWVFSREHNEEFPNLVDAPACGPSRFALRLYASPLGLPLWQWDHACYLQVMGEMSGALQRPYSQGDRGLGDVQLRSVPRICVATRLLVPGLGSVKVKQLEYLARVRLARVGLALRAARSAGQALPAELSGLATAGLDLTDPFTGKPFVYRPSENGFVVYSLAENQTDDGGTPRPARPASKDREKGWDLVWSFPPEPARAAGQ